LLTFTINKEVVELISEVFPSLSTCELDVYAPIIINRDLGHDSATQTWVYIAISDANTPKWSWQVRDKTYGGSAAFWRSAARLWARCLVCLMFWYLKSSELTAVVTAAEIYSQFGSQNLS